MTKSQRETFLQVCGTVLVILFLFVVANHQLKWGYFGDYSKHSLVFICVLLFLYLYSSGALDDRGRKQSSTPAERRRATRIQLLLTGIGALGLAFFVLSPHWLNDEALSKRDLAVLGAALAIMIWVGWGVSRKH